MALYVYGIMRTRDARSAAGGDDRLDVVDHGEIGALVSRLSESERTLRRQTILAHADVLQKASEHGPVLPVRLGTAMPDREAVVRELLFPRAEALALRLGALDGKSEMQVKAAYLEEPLLRTILERDAVLRRAVERVHRMPAAATHFDRIRIGEAIANAVQSRRVADADALLSALRPIALATSVSDPSHERSALNAAFLVDVEALDRFDAEVERLSKALGGEMEFKLIGPLPPYSFAEAEWETTRLAGSHA